MHAGIKTAFETFINGNDVESAIDSSTAAGWGGGAFYVELFDNGTYRVLDGIRLGNKYQAGGLILKIPALAQDDLAEQDEQGNEITPAWYDNALQQLREAFDYADEMV